MDTTRFTNEELQKEYDDLCQEYINVENTGNSDYLFLLRKNIYALDRELQNR